MLIKRRRSIAGLMVLAISLIGFSALLLMKSEAQRQEALFSDYVQNIAGMVRNQLDTNDAVLAGFSAFLQAVDQSDTAATAKYAATILSAYPHIYMLEVARAVPIVDQQGFTALLRQTWRPDFELKQFSTLTQHDAQPQVALAETWPILFMYPAYPQSSAIYGVRLETVPYLSYALAQTHDNPKPIASPVFSLYEGGDAYILMRSVRRTEHRAASALPNFFGSTMVALLIVRTDALLDAVSHVNGDPLVSIVAVMNNTAGSKSTVVSQVTERAPWFDRWLLPRLGDRVEIESSSQPMTLSFGRQLRFSDVLNTETSIMLTVLLGALIVIPLALSKHFIAIKRADAEHERSVYLATHDVLTGLPNRYLLVYRFNQALSRWKNAQVPFAVLLIDLDHFKSINDKHGHAVDDQVLQVVASRMLHASSASDTVARYGGDEFVVLISEVSNPDRAQQQANNMLRAVEQPISTTAGELFISCSIGVSQCPANGKSLDALLKAADQAMYGVKQVGRNGVAMTEQDGVL